MLFEYTDTVKKTLTSIHMTLFFLENPCDVV